MRQAEVPFHVAARSPVPDQQALTCAKMALWVSVTALKTAGPWKSSGCPAPQTTVTASGCASSTSAFTITDVRSVAELERWFPLADLEPDALVLAA
jgi:hypothetical protein